MMYSILILFTSIISIVAEYIKPLVWTELDGNHHHKVVAFYNIYCDGDSYDGIIKDQLGKIIESGLIDKLDIVYYATMGKQGANYVIPNEKFKHITHYGDSGSEVQTLSLLYQFCGENKDSKVLYFHNKGSYHNNWTNVKFRQFLDCFNLNPNCIEALDTHDTCGWRISPVPQPHYSGNFWWATCKHINKLVDPLASVNNNTFIEVTNTLSPCIGSRDRYFPESWVGSAPLFRPSDCMSAAVDTSFLYGYKFPNGITEQYCPKMNTVTNRNEYGLPCTTASTLVNLPLFSGTIDYMQGLADKLGCGGDYFPELVKRSYLWYGTAPTSYIKWMAPLRTPPNMTENELYRGARSKQVFVVKDGKLHGIPNLQTFIAMGRDFDEVKVIHDYQINEMPKGDDIPSSRRLRQKALQSDE